ncbi:hypothetical protein BscR1v2_003580 [Bartonella schoenbuchensis R1]|uniref:Uncharacterized protein n=1 Tax=Bartonella schoenbuchensis (strain DSM 13525 / NCTC 13165 / R1) TaxID=687861 RepID=E6YY30_BARSR|nr:hypothetical protein BscR1v2_003580 [Bartonella schoenbuchensis R1]CBI81841.1 hypothetical protein B11C_20118 [Bartonella schoenbuchensis R1]
MKIKWKSYVLRKDFKMGGLIMIRRKRFFGIVAMFVYFSPDILSYEKLGIYKLIRILMNVLIVILAEMRMMFVG